MMLFEKFSVQEVLSAGWSYFKRHAGFLIVLILFTTLISGGGQFLIDKLSKSGTSFGVVLPLALLFGVVRAAITMVSLKLMLNIVDFDNPTFSSLGSLTSVFLLFLIGLILVGIISGLSAAPLAVLVAFAIIVKSMAIKILLGVLAVASLALLVYISLMFLFTPLLIVDRQLGPIDALLESKAITEGVRLDLFIFSIVAVLLNLLGAVALLVGLLITIPVTGMAMTAIYRKLSPAQPETGVSAS